MGGYVKFGKIPHVPYSESISSDDNWLDNLDHFKYMDIVVTEKVDAENTTMYHDKIHARSIDSMHLFARHPSRTYVKQLHSQIRHLIPEEMRVCGENMYARHAIHYNNLPAYFLAFDIFQWHEKWNDWRCMSWEWTEEICKQLGLQTVPVLYKGPFKDVNLKDFCNIPSALGAPQAEGFVIRNAKRYLERDFYWNNAKWVRANHVSATADHWTTTKVVPNKLKEGAAL